MVTGPLITRRLAAGGLLLLPWAAAGWAGQSAGASAPAAGVSAVVSLDLLLTETLLTLEVVPLAIANIPLYQRLVADPPLPLAVADLGPLQEPNLELLQTLAPTRILAADWQAVTGKVLERIAPVSWLPTFSRERPPLIFAARLLEQVAALVDRRDQAEAWQARAEQHFAAARDRLAALAGQPVYLVRFLDDGRHAAVFGANGMIGDVVRRLGLVNGWTGRTNAWGTTTIGIEQLAKVPEARIIHFDRGAETARALALLDESPIWRALPAVRAGRVTALPVVYPNGGLQSAARLADLLAATLPAALQETSDHG